MNQMLLQLMDHARIQEIKCSALGTVVDMYMLIYVHRC